MLKVLSIAHPAFNKTSGRVRYETLTDIRNDIDLTVIAPDRWFEYGAWLPFEPHVGRMDFRIEPVRLPNVPHAGWYLHYYPGLRRVLTEVQPDVIHLWEEPWSLIGLQAVRLRDKHFPKAAVMFETDQNILRRLPPPFEHIRRYTLKRIDLLIGRQTESLDVARACGFTGPAAIVEYGVDANIFKRQDRDAARTALGLSGFVLGYVGRIVPEKGLHDVLAAMAGCPVPVTLLVLGSGPDSEALEAKAAALGLSDRLRFLKPRPPGAVAEMMNALDALVLMSQTTRTWKEQFGRVIMEAHACGVPVIGSDSGSIPGVIADGGWVVPEGGVPQLTALLRRLTADSALLAPAAAAGLKQAARRFSVVTVANALADSYLAAASARQSRMAQPGV